MANRRTGLPVKKKSVTRLTKSGKMSTYVQAYHVNPFEKSKNVNEKGVKTNTVADQFSISLIKRQKSENKMSIKDFAANLTPTNGAIGSYAAGKLVSKVKSRKDIISLRESYFDPVFSEGFFNGDNIGKHTGLLRDTSKIVNNIPQNPHAYDQIVQSIIRNKSNIHKTAMTNISASFQNHQMLNDTLRANIPKSESYEREEFLHDFNARIINPIGQVGTFFKNNLTDPLKASIQGLYGIPNDLEYINNPPIMTEKEVQMWESWITENNKQISTNLSDGILYKQILVEMNPKVASEIFKSDKIIDIPIYQSTIMDLSSKKQDTNLKLIKDFSLQNETEFGISSVKFVIDDNLKVYLSFIIEVNNLTNRDFVSVSQQRTNEYMNDYNKKTLDILSDSDLSRIEVEKILIDETNDFKAFNDDSFVMINA